MLNVEIIKFEAQDVITASVMKLPDCTSGTGHNMAFVNNNGVWGMSCSICGYTGTATGGTIVGGGG